MKRKIGFSLCGKPYDAAAMERYARAGIEAVEFSFATEVYDTYNFAEGAKLARACGMDPWSAHLTFCPFEATISPLSTPPFVKAPLPCKRSF